LAKHLLYLNNNQLTSSMWDKGIQSSVQTFNNYASGWLQFSEYLQAHRDVPVYLLTDLVEEDFQNENIPHVFGLAKQNLIQRRLAALYRDTPYREASQQGREKEGRRDDKMLFSALTNAQLLKPWLDALMKEKIDVAGIYSVALLNPLLFKKLDLGKESTLLVTHQSSGLRQSYFHEGHLRFSRLAPETAWSAEAIAEFAESEIVKIRQFLASTRLMARGAAINIVVVADTKIIQHLRPLSPDVEGMHYRFIDLNEAQQVFGLPKLPEQTLCDALFLSLLASKRIPAHYATFEQTRLHKLSQARATLKLFSVLTIAAAVILASGNVLDAFHMSNLTKRAQQETQQALANYQATTTSMPVTVANPHDMKVAVDVARMIQQNGPTPNPMLTLISKALDTLPQIKIHELNWQVNETDGAAPDAAAAPPPPLASGEVVPLSASLIGIPAKPFEILTLEAEVMPFNNDYRTALESVRQFTLELQKNTHVRVEVITPALDIRPSVKLESQAGNDSDLPKPRFSLKLVWKP
jgi:hypothetical protein